MKKPLKEEFKYSIKEEKPLAEDSLILKEGYFKSSAQFTINDIKKDITALNKKKDELEAKNKISEALAINISNHNEFVEKMPEKDRIAVFLYEKAKTEVKATNEYIDAINKQLDAYAKEVAEIVKQLNITIDFPKRD